MFEPIRGGTRGGQAEFKWSDVSQDKDRENYLGHSINAPTGRWQKNKDIHWYQRDANTDEEARLEELRKVKEQEAEALAAMLGFGTNGKPGSSSAGPVTGANAVAAPVSQAAGAELDPEKEERRKRKAERKEEKRAKKEAKRGAKERRRVERDDEEHGGRRPHHRRSRSRSPRRHPRDYDDRSRSRHRSRTPPRRTRDPGSYDDGAREKERERDRRRWDNNARREQPGARWGRE